MSEDKPKGENKPKMKFPPQKKKHRIHGDLPPSSPAADSDKQVEIKDPAPSRPTA